MRTLFNIFLVFKEPKSYFTGIWDRLVILNRNSEIGFFLNQYGPTGKIKDMEAEALLSVVTKTKWEKNEADGNKFLYCFITAPEL